MQKIRINADGLILGRMATYAARKLLEGYEVEVYNAGRVIITGNKPFILERERAKRDRGSNVRKGPYYTHTPEGYVKRVIRGMLPWKTTRGREAYKRLRVYDHEAPEDAERVETARAEASGTLKQHRLKDIIKSLGV